MSLNAIDLGKIRKFKDDIAVLDDRIGGWTTKADLRQTGMSVHFKFGNKVDIDTVNRFLWLIENGPGLLVNAQRLLLGEPQIIAASGTGDTQ